MKIWLIGMMGSGKTSVGELVAANLGVPFADTDRLVEERLGSSIANYWTEHGEAAFRDVEREVVAGLQDAEGIIATGGGAVVDQNSRTVITRTGTVVWLDARPEELAARVGEGADRPLVTTAKTPARALLESTLDMRSEIYREMADHTIHTDDLSPEEVAERVEALWKP